MRNLLFSRARNASASLANFAQQPHCARSRRTTLKGGSLKSARFLALTLFMPDKPLWLDRLPQAIATLEGSSLPWVDRRTIEDLLASGAVERNRFSRL
jgi:hypothetical protein